MSSAWRDFSPRSVKLYSCATTSSATPHTLKIRAQITPVRSFPAVQWIRQGAGDGDEDEDEDDGEARCSRIVLNGW